MSKKQLQDGSFGKPIASKSFSGPCVAEMKNDVLTIGSDINDIFSFPRSVLQNTGTLLPVFLIKAESDKIFIGEHAASSKLYSGELMIIANDKKIRPILYCPLELYVQSVLHGEMPADYHIEAIKCQAVCARNYGLYPRVDHSSDSCDVCDSYQCCQCFAGLSEEANSSYKVASQATSGEVLVYKNEPVLALFSSCGGGHTENYEDCFSDWKTNQFPPTPIPYLRGVSEDIANKQIKQVIDEKDLKILWNMTKPPTADAWGRQFRWSISLSNRELESQIHNNVMSLLNQKDVTPFVVSPSSGVFGEILSLEVLKRGVGGTIITLKISTSKGDWKFTKELVIRNLFQMPNIQLTRLKSAKFYFDQIRDKHDQLIKLNIYGLGWGHGVGLQQVGAEGFARLGKNYTQILAHYYTETSIAKI